jgi:hypothetical protein
LWSRNLARKGDAQCIAEIVAQAAGKHNSYLSYTPSLLFFRLTQLCDSGFPTHILWGRAGPCLRTAISQPNRLRLGLHFLGDRRRELDLHGGLKRSGVLACIHAPRFSDRGQLPACRQVRPERLGRQPKCLGERALDHGRALKNVRHRKALPMMRLGHLAWVIHTPNGLGTSAWVRQSKYALV